MIRLGGKNIVLFVRTRVQSFAFGKFHSCNLPNEWIITFKLEPKGLFKLVPMFLQISFEVIYQTRKTVFDHISKHRGESGNYDTLRNIFDDIWGD